MAADKGDNSIAQSIDTIEQKLNVLGRAVFGSDGFGQLSNAGLVVRHKLTKQLSDQMGKGLHLYNMPTRDDVTSLAERCAKIDERLLGIEALLLELLDQQNLAPPSGPPRTKKPKTSRTKKPARQVRTKSNK